MIQTCAERPGGSFHYRPMMSRLAGEGEGGQGAEDLRKTEVKEKSMLATEW